MCMPRSQPQRPVIMFPSHPSLQLRKSMLTLIAPTNFWSQLQQKRRVSITALRRLFTTRMMSWKIRQQQFRGNMTSYLMRCWQWEDSRVFREMTMDSIGLWTTTSESIAAVEQEWLHPRWGSMRHLQWDWSEWRTLHSLTRRSCMILVSTITQATSSPIVLLQERATWLSQ